MNREMKKRIKIFGKILFALYILVLIYFLFFDGALGQYFVIEGDEDWVMEDAWG